MSIEGRSVKPPVTVEIRVGVLTNAVSDRAANVHACSPSDRHLLGTRATRFGTLLSGAAYRTEASVLNGNQKAVKHRDMPCMSCRGLRRAMRIVIGVGQDLGAGWEQLRPRRRADSGRVRG